MRIEEIVQAWNERYPESPIQESLVVMGAVTRTARQFDLLFAEELERQGLQASQVDSLFSLLDSLPEPRSASGLAESSGVTNATMTYRLDKMEENAWIRRLPHPTDRRANLIELTEEGKRIGLLAMRIKNEVAARLLQPLPQEHSAQLMAQLVRILRAAG